MSIQVYYILRITCHAIGLSDVRRFGLERDVRNYIADLDAVHAGTKFELTKIEETTIDL